MYDRGGLVFLPQHNPAAATGAPSSWDLDQAATAEALLAFPAPTHGRLHSLFYSVTEATLYDTLPAIVAVHVNDVEVGTVTITTGKAQGVDAVQPIVVASGKVLDFKPGDIIKLEIKQRPTSSGGVTGQISPHLMVTLDSV